MIQKLYPEIEPYNSQFIKVSDTHEVYFEEVGNPNGKPVVFLHGGPGGGLSPFYRRFFDPSFYRVILLDQRGSGKSLPFAEIKENTTWDIVNDLEKIRDLLNIPKWLIFGGSWGSTLGLAYAVKHPDSVIGLILRGIFLGSKKEVDWLFQEGASYLFPDDWEDFINVIPESKRGDLISAYYEILTSDNESEKLKAAKAFSTWEGSISKLVKDKDLLEDFSDAKKAIPLARMECHYMINKLFFDTDTYLLDNVDRIKHLPCRIIHGRYDIVCTPKAAWDLHKKYDNSELVFVDAAGHSLTEKGITTEHLKATEDFKKYF